MEAGRPETGDLASPRTSPVPPASVRRPAEQLGAFPTLVSRERIRSGAAQPALEIADACKAEMSMRRRLRPVAASATRARISPCLYCSILMRMLSRGSQATKTRPALIWVTRGSDRIGPTGPSPQPPCGHATMITARYKATAPGHSWQRRRRARLSASSPRKAPASATTPAAHASRTSRASSPVTTPPFRCRREPRRFEGRRFGRGEGQGSGTAVPVGGEARTDGGGFGAERGVADDVPLLGNGVGDHLCHSPLFQAHQVARPEDARAASPCANPDAPCRGVGNVVAQPVGRVRGRAGHRSSPGVAARTASPVAASSICMQAGHSSGSGAVKAAP